MKTTYRHGWLGFLVAILMMPLAYGQNETILVANFMNGNNAFLLSRIYLFNSSDTAGDITVRVFRLPPISGLPQELTGAPFFLGVLEGKSAVNIKLAEDILIPLLIPTPYLTHGGNLALEFTVAADKVRGVAQVFTSDFAFGTYPLQGPESISGTVPGGEIPDGSVTNSKIANGAVTGGKIANGAVGSVQLADVVIFGASGSRGAVAMLNSTGAVATVLGAGTDESGNLFLLDSGGNTLAQMGPDTGGNGALETWNAAGSNLVSLTTTTDGSGLISASDSSGNELARMGANSAGNGTISTKNAAGTTLVSLTTAAADGSGFISVRDSNGTRTAGIDGSTGQVFGNSKSFIVTDPSDSNRMIQYTSVEGPEAAIYVRGTANLVSGQGHINFPAHFAVMAVPSSITVSLTPRSASSMGLAAVSVSSQGIDVAELGGGANSYSFDYVVYAVRKGFEDYKVYLTQEQVRGLTGQAQALELRPRSLLNTSPLKAIQRQE